MSAGSLTPHTILGDTMMREMIMLEVVGEQRLVCESCELRVKRLFKDLHGLVEVDASARMQRIEVRFDATELRRSVIADRLAAAGYETRELDAAIGGA